MSLHDQSNQAVSVSPDPASSTGARPASGGHRSAWGWLAAAVPVIVFAVVWAIYAINVPKWDDHALREFLYNFDQAATLPEKIYHVFRQHNEHRIVYDRLITLLDVGLFGELNFRHLMLVGNLSLVGLLLVFATVLRQEIRVSSSWAVAYTLPVALLLFNLAQWENMFWGMAALQNFSVVFWVLLSIFWLSYTNRWGLALISAVLATLTSGNGLLVWPIGFVLLVFRLTELIPGASSALPARLQRRQSLRWLGGWGLGAVIVIGLYFTGFEKPAGNPPARGSVTDLLKGWLAFIGSAADALPTNQPLLICLALGSLLLLATVGMLVNTIVERRAAINQLFGQLQQPKEFRSGAGAQFPPSTLFVWGCALFILGTATVVAWSRTGFGVDILITSRYKVYSLTLLALLYVYGLVSIGNGFRRWFVLGSVAGSLVLAGCSYLTFLDETIWWRHWLTTNQFNWTHSTNRPVVTRDPVSERYTRLAPAFYDTALATIYGPANQPPVRVSMRETPVGYAVTNTTIPALGLRDAGAYLLARSAKRTYLFPVWQNQRSVVRARFLPAQLFTTGFRADILTSELEAGTYDLFMLTVSADNRYGLHPTQQTITSVGRPVDTTEKNW